MPVKMIAVQDLQVGDILADTVLSGSGKVLLGKNVEVSTRHITLLKTWDVRSVFVNAKEGDVPSPQNEAETENKNEAIKKVSSEEYLQFVQEYDAFVTSTAQTFDFIRKHKIIPLPPLKDAAGNIHAAIMAKGLTVMNYLLIGDYKLADYVSRHSVMVAYFAACIAQQMKWSDEDIKGVALAGLLHDVGSLVADKAALNGRAHIAEAAGVLREVKSLAIPVILGVVQHRECIDGSGYPTGSNEQKIHPYAKVIAVADMFHNQAYASDHANPFPVLDLLLHEMFGKFDPSVCHVFISRIKDSMLHNHILLTNGQQAEVVYFHPNGSCLPMVKTTDNKIVDLSKQGSLAISRIISPSDR